MRHQSLVFPATVSLLIATAFMAGIANRRSPEPLAVPLGQIDSQIAGWRAVRDRALPDSTLHTLNATSYLSRTYGKGKIQLDLFIAFYAQQRAGESMHSPKHCLPGAGWEIWKHDSAWIPVNGQAVESTNTPSRIGNENVDVVLISIQDPHICERVLGQRAPDPDTMLTGHTAGSIVRVMVPDYPSAAEEGVAFATSVIPEVQRCLGHHYQPSDSEGRHRL